MTETTPPFSGDPDHTVSADAERAEADRADTEDSATPDVGAANTATPDVGRADTPLLTVGGLTVDYLGGRKPARACNEISFTLNRGEILGVAGESASGKSTLLTAIMRLQRPPAVIADGSVIYHKPDGTTIDLASARESQIRPLRWVDLSIVMQSAMAALNPVTRLGKQFYDVFGTHYPKMTEKQQKQRAGDLLEMVGIDREVLRKFPHEMSGGMRQRALIALSLACDPELIVMDEPTTAVDVVMQREILEQILDLQAQFGFAIIFVTHDLSLLLEMADRIAIMYGGRIVELADAEDIADSPSHPYTEGLRNAFPSLTEPLRELQGIPGTPPNLLDLPSGCAFHPRCSLKIDRCESERPELEADQDGRLAACHVRVGSALAQTVTAERAQAKEQTP